MTKLRRITWMGTSCTELQPGSRKVSGCLNAYTKNNKWNFKTDYLRIRTIWNFNIVRRKHLISSNDLNVFRTTNFWANLTTISPNTNEKKGWMTNWLWATIYRSFVGTNTSPGYCCVCCFQILFDNSFSWYLLHMFGPLKSRDSKSLKDDKHVTQVCQPSSHFGGWCCKLPSSGWIVGGETDRANNFFVNCT